MSDKAKELTDKNFDSETKSGKWVIDFWATWCGPCKIMGPHFDAAASELSGKVNFGKVNVDENYELSEKFKVMSIPTTMFLQNGEIVNISVGAMNKEQILQMIENSFD